MLSKALLTAAGVLACSVWARGALPLLFMDLEDVTRTRGLLEPVAGAVAPARDLFAPPLDYARGGIVFGVLPVRGTDGAWAVYGANATGPEPLEVAGHGSLVVRVLRFETRDFRTYAAPTVCLTFSSGGDPYVTIFIKSQSFIVTLAC